VTARKPRRVVIALAAGLPSSAGAIGAAAPVHAAEPMPEPILGETVTDIDGAEAGEVEWEANGSVMRALRGRAYSLDASVEIEWLVTRGLGVRLEPSLGRDVSGSKSSIGAGASGGISLKVLQDFERQLYVDVEVLGRVPATEETPVVQVGDPAQPFTGDVHAGVRLGPLTLRGSVGVGVGGASAGLPLRGGAALLLPIDPSGRFGFCGLEVDVDGARPAPAVIALNVVPNFVPAGIPVRVGLALPWVPGEQDTRPSFGIYLRVFYESAREIEFARGTGGR
jgi:hypothetical protein